MLPFLLIADPLLAPTPLPVVAAPMPRGVDNVFGFQQFFLEQELPPELAPEGDVPDVYHVYGQDVRLGERRMRIYLTFYKGKLATIELQPADTGELADLRADLIGMYGRPTRQGPLKATWEGKLAHMTWVQIFGATVVTLSSNKLEAQMKKDGAI